MTKLEDHTHRYAMANELHARPFPAVTGPGQAAYLAIKQPIDAANRDRNLDRAHLLALLDRYGAPHPAPGATHYYGELGRYRLKWESHTEFVTYTLFGDIPEGRAFDPNGFSGFPEDWLAEAPGVRVTSVLLRVEPMPEDRDAVISEKLGQWFVRESLAASLVLGGAALVAGDFHIDPAGHMRMAVFMRDGVGSDRTGRIVQRLLEIETYKSMALLALPRARSLSGKMGEMDQQLSELVDNMRKPDAPADQTLEGLLVIAAELETMIARSSFRFGARGAYDAIVAERISALRERRYVDCQTLGEFMMRRFDPAMRTCLAVESRMEAMSVRAKRAGDLLSTRVNVERSAQNQSILESMDQRSDLQLRLQRTVEGLSVVAISYYTLNLVSYFLYPVASHAGLTKDWVFALATVPVILLVWMMVHRIRKRMEG